jgi:hypothetical protein
VAGDGRPCPRGVAPTSGTLVTKNWRAPAL